MRKAISVCLLASCLLSAGGAAAEQTLKIGLILPMTGPQATTGAQIDAAVRLYLQQHGAIVAGRRIEVILKDDGSVTENTRRLAQELITRDKVSILAGFGVTPGALAVAQLATAAKIPQVVMATGASVITERSPYIVRTSFTLPQTTVVLADWAAKNGIRKVVTMVSDFAPGVDAETSFKERFVEAGGQVLESLRFPLANPDFSPFLQRAREASPDAIFVFVVSGQSVSFAKQFVQRGLDKSGIRLLGTGALTDDAVLRAIPDEMIGTVTAHFYSAAHVSRANESYVAAFRKANPGMRPNFFSVSGYDGMHLICEALRKTGGSSDGDALIAAMKGMAWESPRGPISIDPETRDVIQNVYISRLEKIDGELFNVEFAIYEAIKDPIKAAKK